MYARATAERLMLVTVLDRWFNLDRPVFIKAGQSYWIDYRASELCIEDEDGRVSRVPGWMCR